MRTRKVLAAVVAPLAITSVTIGALVVGGQDWMGNWGATMVERSARLPGDEVLPEATNFGTKAITISATPEQVWPWIAQMGIRRAGMYSYDWIERIVGSGEFVDGHSAERIHPELQERQVGDEMLMHPPTDMKYTVAMVNAPRLIVYRGNALSTVTWTFYLIPTDGGTRLITRWRGQQALGLGDQIANNLFGAMDFVMEQKMLRGIRERAERAAETGRSPGNLSANLAHVPVLTN